MDGCDSRIGIVHDFLDDVRAELARGPVLWAVAVDMAARRGVPQEDARALLLDLAAGRDVDIVRGTNGAPALAWRAS